MGRRGTATPFTPPVIPDCVIWLRADLGVYTTSGGSTPSGNGDPVGRWEDQSGAGNHVAQATAGNRPTLSTSTVGGQPGITFAANGIVLTRGGIPALQVRAQSWWAVLGWANPAPSSLYAFSNTYASVANTNCIAIAAGDPGNTRGNGRTSGGTVVTIPTANGSVPHSAAYRADNAGGVSIRVNDGSDATNTGSNYSVATHQSLDVGNALNGLSPCIVPLCEVAAWSRQITNDELAQLWAYTSSRYGL